MPRRDTDTTLLGAYATPTFQYGDVVMCALRGEVTLLGLRDAPVPWPVGKKAGRRGKALVLCAGLADAVRRESAAAVMHWWRVGPDTVWKWRKALAVSPTTEGTTRLRSKSIPLAKMQAAARPTLSCPERAAKISAAKRGVARPPEVGRKVGRAHLGKKASAETRRKMSEAQKGRTGPGRRWSADEDGLARALTPQEAARRTGRSVVAVWARRRKLG
jgi:hypothetical protein